jgi:hypothetical protein
MKKQPHSSFSRFIFSPVYNIAYLGDNFLDLPPKKEAMIFFVFPRTRRRIIEGF